MSEKRSKPKKGAARRPNKAQQRASEVRAAQTASPPPVVRHAESGATVAVVEEAVAAVPKFTPVTTRPNVYRRGGAPKVVARPVGMSRADEYAAIRADLVRLLLTFGALMLVMLVLLFVLNP